MLKNCISMVNGIIFITSRQDPDNNLHLNNKNRRETKENKNKKVTAHGWIAVVRGKLGKLDIEGESNL